MAEKTVVISVPPGKLLKIIKWKVKRDVFVPIGTVILLYNDENEKSPTVLKFKANKAGTVKALSAVEGEVLQPGSPLLELEACSHPTVMKDMCAECGADLRCDDKPLHNASVPMIHSVPELKVSEELAQKLGKEDSERLLRDRKLVLLVDLDQTLIHTTNDNIPANIKDVHHFQLRGWSGGPPSCGRWYHARLRPGTAAFLRAVAAHYELHICTFGARAYAHKVAALLDPASDLFSHRILSRDECFDVHMKTPNLRALFPCGDNLVCIIDDREDVWNRATNLIQVKPYHFFEHTGDINAPPGLEKTERDMEGQGIHLQDLTMNEDTKTSPDNNGTSIVSEEMPSLDFESNEADKKDACSNVAEDKVDDSKKSTGGENVNDGVENVSKNVEEIDDKQKQSDDGKENISDKTDHLTDKNDELKDKEVGGEIIADIEMKEVNLSNALSKEDDSKVKDVKSSPVDDSEKEKDDQVGEIETAKDETADLENAAAEESAVLDDNNIDLDSKENLLANDVEVEPSGDTNDVPIQPTKWRTTEDGMIEVEDADDYLLYLEEILKRIHKFFYEVYDAMEAGSVPDLKTVIPQVKSQVLAGKSLVFSGLIPTYQKLEHSRAYMVARSLGAEVTQDFTKNTTHLVAVRPGTAKVHASRRCPTPVHTVTPGWLWSCAERWQHADERLFPLKGGAGRPPRRPPPHCGSPPRAPSDAAMPVPAQRKRTPSGRFMDTINPLLSFSSDDIADMDREVEDIINESDESESEDRSNTDTGNQRLTDDPFDVEDSIDAEDALKNDLANISSTSDSSAESLSGGEHPHGWKPGRLRKRRRASSVSGNDSEPVSPPKHVRDMDLRMERDEPEVDDSTCEDLPSEKFRRGEDLPSDGPDRNDSDSEASVGPPDETDDGEWNMMGAALEREFLGLDK